MVTAIIALIDVIAVQNILGESANWHTASGQLWWTDIQGRRLYRYNPASQVLSHFDTPRRLCSFAFADGGGLIAAFENGVALYNPASQACDWLFRLADNHAPIRFNDGRTDRQGRFWAGTMMEGPFDSLRPLGQVYCFDRSGMVQRHREKVKITNSLCSSPDGRLLYFSDSPQHVIYVCDQDPDSGALSHQRVFAHTPAGAQPDGAVTDSEGCLWSAQWGASRLVRYTPDGRIADIVTMPVSQPTSIAFGGPQMNLLCVTTARDGLPQDELMRQPQAGDLFIYQTDVTGLADAQFA